MLEKLGKLEERDVTRCEAQFKKFDKTGDGQLDEDDIMEGMEGMEGCAGADVKLTVNPMSVGWEDEVAPSRASSLFPRV